MWRLLSWPRQDSAFLADPLPFLTGCLETATSALAGFALAAAAGILLASLLSLSRAVERSVYPLTLLFQMVPLIAIAPLRVIWRASHSTVENRQLRTLPSAVSRNRLQDSQNGDVTGLIRPIRPFPSANS